MTARAWFLHADGTTTATDPRGLSLDRPWSSAVPLGLKRFETRGWRTRYRGALAIHATVKKLPAIIKGSGITADWLAQATAACGPVDQQPAGAIVALADLACCIPTEDIAPGPDEAFWGNYTPGRSAFGLMHIRPLAMPYPFLGKQGLWTIPPATWAALEDRAMDPLPPGPFVFSADAPSPA